MADIFLSYAREDRPAIEPLAAALEQAGWSVWWDRNLAGGSRYLSETEKELTEAQAVLVAWSRASITSHWVADEAAAGRDAGKLVPISLDGSVPPLGFRQFQVIDFQSWPESAEPFADLLASLARFGAPSGSAATGNSTPRAVAGGAQAHRSTPPRRLPVPLLAALAGAVLLAAAIWGGMALLRPAPSAKPGERIAVFGFTPSDSDPQSAELAAAATDETFKSMSLMRLDVVARGETQGTPADQRLARAKELGAHYAVSGEASGPPDRTGRVTLRIEDVPSRTTLWETSINEVHFPAIQSGATSTLMLECIARDRTHLPEADPDTTRLIATACRVWSAIGDLALALPARRELAARNPRNPHFAAELAFALGVFELTPNPERVAEMRAAIEAARALAPDSPALAAAEWRYGAYTGKRLAGSQAPLDRWLKGGDVDDTVVGTRLLRFLGNHLGRTGRINDALKAFTDAEGLRPVSEPASFTTLRARMLAQRGAMRQADDLYRLAYARSGNATVWHWWLDDALVLGVGDPETIVRLAPAGGRADATQCWERIVELWSAGQKMSGLQHAIACNQAGNLNADHVLILSAHLGQTDLAFRHLDFVATTPVVAYWLFSPATRPLRTEKRFLAEIQQLGLWDYWLETQTQPDVCLTKEEKGFPVCVELEKALAEKAASASAAPAPTKP